LASDDDDDEGYKQTSVERSFGKKEYLILEENGII